MIQNESNVTLSSENISFKHAILIVLTAVFSYLRQPYEILRDGGVSCRTYPALESLVEPHRLISCLHCTVSGARSMIADHQAYPEGRLHVIPLLCLSLPGIDSNDCKKCLVSRL